MLAKKYSTIVNAPLGFESDTFGVEMNRFANLATRSYNKIKAHINVTSLEDTSLQQLYKSIR